MTGRVGVQRLARRGAVASKAAPEATSTPVAKRGGVRPSAVPVLDRAAARPLATGVRSIFESRLGDDLSDVRVHTDGSAAAASRAMGALAYTVGSDVVFASGRFAPETAAGRELLAHELVHVVQTRRAGGPAGRALSDRSDPAEAEADALAPLLHASGPRLEVREAPRGAIQRKGDAGVAADLDRETADGSTSGGAALESLDEVLAQMPSLDYQGDVFMLIASAQSIDRALRTTPGWMPHTRRARATKLLDIHRELIRLAEGSPRSTDGVLMRRDFGELAPWTPARPKRVADIPVFSAENVKTWTAVANDAISPVQMPARGSRSEPSRKADRRRPTGASAEIPIVDQPPRQAEGPASLQPAMANALRKAEERLSSANIGQTAISDRSGVRDAIAALSSLSLDDISQATHVPLRTAYGENKLSQLTEVILYHSVFTVVLDSAGEPLDRNTWLREYPILVSDPGVILQRNVPAPGLKISLGPSPDLTFRIGGGRITQTPREGVGGFVELLPPIGSKPHEFQDIIEAHLKGIDRAYVASITSPSAFDPQAITAKAIIDKVPTLFERTLPLTAVEVGKRLHSDFENFDETIAQLGKDLIRQLVEDKIKSLARNFLIEKVGEEFVPGLNFAVSLYGFAMGGDERNRIRHALAAMMLAVQGASPDDMTIAAKVLAKITADEIYDDIRRDLVNSGAQLAHRAAGAAKSAVRPTHASAPSIAPAPAADVAHEPAKPSAGADPAAAPIPHASAHTPPVTGDTAADLAEADRVNREWQAKQAAKVPVPEPLGTEASGAAGASHRPASDPPGAAPSPTSGHPAGTQKLLPAGDVTTSPAAHDPKPSAIAHQEIVVTRGVEAVKGATQKLNETARRRDAAERQVTAAKKAHAGGVEAADRTGDEAADAQAAAAGAKRGSDLAKRATAKRNEATKAAADAVRAKAVHERAERDLLERRKAEAKAVLQAKRARDRLKTSRAYLGVLSAEKGEAPRLRRGEPFDPKKRRPNLDDFKDIPAAAIDRHAGPQTKRDARVGVFKEQLATDARQLHDKLFERVQKREITPQQAGHEYETLVGRDLAGDDVNLRQTTKAADKERRTDLGPHEFTIEPELRDDKLDQLWRDLQTPTPGSSTPANHVLLTVPRLSDPSAERLARMAAVYEHLTGHRPRITVRETAP
jgi:hypothetical protein